MPLLFCTVSLPAHLWRRRWSRSGDPLWRKLFCLCFPRQHFSLPSPSLALPSTYPGGGEAGGGGRPPPVFNPPCTFSLCASYLPPALSFSLSICLSGIIIKCHSSDDVIINLLPLHAPSMFSAFLFTVMAFSLYNFLFACICSCLALHAFAPFCFLLFFTTFSCCMPGRKTDKKKKDD